jgi:hypothetical protein
MDNRVPLTSLESASFFCSSGSEAHPTTMAAKIANIVKFNLPITTRSFHFLETKINRM